MDVAGARDADGSQIVELRDAAARWLQSRGVEQWSPGEVSVDRVRRQIEAGQWYVVRRHERVLAALRLLNEDPEVWGAQKDSALYVHGLVTDRDVAGMGFGASVLRWVERIAVQQGKSWVRLDCVASNERLRHFYREQGFLEVGSHSFGEGGPSVVLFEKHV
jgi:ribosomal protein S18 acetylase RimI-like enzyme